MVVARQLHQLQETDLEIETNEGMLTRITAELAAGSPPLATTQARLKAQRQHLDELGKQQRSAEWEVADLSGKVTAIDAKLYSGRITNPKELSNLQDESNVLKAKRSQLEDRVIRIMEQVETAEASIVNLGQQVRELETEWRRHHKQLTGQAEAARAKLVDLKARREELLAAIDQTTAETYRRLRTQKGTAVARLEQGMCASCRIQVPVAKLQQVRSGSLVQCSNCARILFLP